MGPLEASKPWNTRAVDGVTRFLNRSYRLYVEGEGLRSNLSDKDASNDKDLEKALHRCIKKVTEDLESMSFNTAIAAMMIFVNEGTSNVDKLSHSQLSRYAQILSVFAPHLGEELWSMLGYEGSVSKTEWPTYDEQMCKQDELVYPIQINGKVRVRMNLDAEASREIVEEKAREAASKYLEGKTVKKVIVVPKRLVNFVVG